MAEIVYGRMRTVYTTRQRDDLQLLTMMGLGGQGRLGLGGQSGSGWAKEIGSGRTGEIGSGRAEWV